MNKNNKTNGVAKLPDELEKVRIGLIADEFRARHWKAQYETAYYHLQFTKILPEYQELLDKINKEHEEFVKKQNEFLEQLKQDQNITEIVEVNPEEVENGNG